MPLHDWSGRSGWEGVHVLWITELLRWVKPRLPAGYRAYLGSAPRVAMDVPFDGPDVVVQPPPEPTVELGFDQPDDEIAVATIDPGTTLYIETQGRLVAAVELVSPRNKDRPIARATYLARYVGYLLEGVHLLLVDVHRRPLNFSFADGIAQELQLRQPACPPPLAVSYRVGEPAATGGRLLGIWRRPLAVESPLPSLPLPLNVTAAVVVDLEQTYSRPAADAYLT